MKRFENQVAIVTGGARGIGHGIGKRLASEGATVVLFDVLEKELNQTVSGLKSEGYVVEGTKVDITDEADVRTSIAQVVEKYGKLDVLINSAGIVGPNGCKILDYDYQDFQRVIDVNLHGAFLVTKYAIQHMEPRKYGRVLLIASIGGKEGNPGMIGYAASKSGVMGIVKGVGKEYADVGITVNGLAPAVIATPMNLDTHPDTMKYMVSKIPMGRLGTVEETAAISCWIVSPEASFNSGFIFDLSGGRATF